MRLFLFYEFYEHKTRKWFQFQNSGYIRGERGIARKLAPNCSLVCRKSGCPEYSQANLSIITISSEIVQQKVLHARYPNTF